MSSGTISNPELTVYPGASTYYVTGTDKNGCSNRDSVSIAISAGPKVSVHPSDTFGCAGTTIQLHATGAQSYKWFPPTGLSDDAIANPALLVGASPMYVVTGKDSNGCEGYDTLYVTGYPLPRVHATQEQLGDDCGNSEVQLHASGAQSYLWTPGFYADYNNIPNPKVKIPNTIVFTVYGTDSNGCIGSDTVIVLYKGKTIVGMPNAFTPNQDNNNDKIHPLIICDFTLTEFSIFNRWGQRVFTTRDPGASWDGTYNGTPCEMDVYFYMIKGINSKNEEQLLKGDITLIR